MLQNNGAATVFSSVRPLTKHGAQSAMAKRFVRPTEKNSKRKPRVDLSGRRYGKLTVLFLSGYRGVIAYWRCRCDCGQTKEITTSNLKRTESCGCVRMVDLTGRRRNKLTVIKSTGEWWLGKPLWLCRCDCGNERILGTKDFICGRQTSCGCAKKGSNAIHGKQPERLYNTWVNMRARCQKPNTFGYHNYGGRGISVCEEWGGRHCYLVFRDWSFANGWAPNLEIDRINNDGNYEPSNCRWATREMQVNNRRCNRWITLNGETHTHAQWEKKLGMKEGSIGRRVARGFTGEEALLLPLGKKRKLFFGA